MAPSQKPFSSMALAATILSVAIVGSPFTPTAQGFNLLPTFRLTSSFQPRCRPQSVLLKSRNQLDDDVLSTNPQNVQQNFQLSTQLQSRTSFLSNLATITLSSTAVSLVSSPQPALALVKGNAPPPKTKKDTEEKKCRNVEECQEMAERKQAALMEEEMKGAGNVRTAPGGTKYLDIGDVSGAVAGAVAKTGDKVEIYYKVLKLGKRSYDGLSGEGTVVFSRGYALEDDEKVPGDKSFIFTLGDPSIITALNEAIPGMTPTSTRRISVPPQKGWEKNTPQCDGGPGGKGAGGELKTDYVVVPTATMVDQEACFERGLKPFPGTYAQERRMAQRFDQSLIVEVTLARIL